MELTDKDNMEASTIWGRIKALCRKNGISQHDLSEMLGYGPRNLEVKIARNSYPNALELSRFADIFKVSCDFLLSGSDDENASKKFFVPVLNQELSAGKGQLLNDDEITGYIAVPDALRSFGENIAALSVSGDSMEPTLRRGDMVVCDSCGYDGEGLYALQMDGDGFVKRVYKDSGKFVIKSDNPMYPVREEPVGSDGIKIVGRVHYIIHRCD